MQYSVSDFQDLIYDLDVSTGGIAKVYAAWGDVGDSGWTGGFCLKTVDGEYVRLTRANDDVDIEISEGKLKAPKAYLKDYISSPGDLEDWLNDGADPLEAHVY